MRTRTSMIKLLILFAFILTVCQTYGQWSIQPGVGLNIPVTGYKTISDGGILYQIDVAKILGNNRWRIGLMLGWARMHEDNNESDKFINARLDQMPVLVAADYEFSEKQIRPYAGLGLG